LTIDEIFCNKLKKKLMEGTGQDSLSVFLNKVE